MTPDRPSRRDFLRHGSAALVAGCSLATLYRPAPAGQPDAKPAEVESRRGIACYHREAADAARDVLLQGGNAVDAAVAALLVECVIAPAKVGLGGYAGSFVLYNSKTGRVHAIDADCRAPRKFDPATFNADSARHGYLAVGVPGVIAGIDLALKQFGTMPFKSLATHALALAENGTTITPLLARTFEQLGKTIDPVSRRAYLPNGPPADGANWVQPDLARLIRRLGDEGLASFYTGEIAATIAKQVQDNGGALTADDFHDFHATLVEPLQINYRGHNLYTPPIPSAGITSLSILKTLEQFDLSQLAPWGAPYVELFTGVARFCWKERYEYFGDTDFVKVPVDELLSDQRALARADKLRKQIASPELRKSPDSVGRKSPDPAPQHTVNIVVTDKDQNVVSWTATHGDDFGAHVAIEGLGLMLGHGMSRFTTDSASPNFPAAGKRPQHNMSPMLVLRDGKPYASLGLPGGPVIVTCTTQMVVNLIDFHATPQQVVSSPRFHIEGEEPIKVTADTPAAVVNELRQRGHQVDVLNRVGGEANALVIDQKTGSVQAAASGDSTGAAVF